MKIPGKRVRRTRLVRTHRFVVAVEVEAVIPEDDPSEPCFEAETVELLRQVEEHAQRGDVEWLRQHGTVYQALYGDDMFFVGVDGCHAGWFAVSLNENGQWEVMIFRNVRTLWSVYCSAALILIDIPIGLPEKGSRECDKVARTRLGAKRGSSVFPVPCRAAVDASPDKKMVCRINERVTGKRLSLQALGIVEKIREVDELLTMEIGARDKLREIHPEILFWAMAGYHPMRHPKKTEQGFLERREVLRRFLPETDEIIRRASSLYRPSALAKDDVLDALVAAVTASGGKCELHTIPETPERDAQGLRMEMVYRPSFDNLAIRKKAHEDV